jgi:hypothetical protein
MKSYLKKISGRQERRYPESRIVQTFADQQLNRYAPCNQERAATGKRSMALADCTNLLDANTLSVA